VGDACRRHSQFSTARREPRADDDIRAPQPPRDSSCQRDSIVAQRELPKKACRLSISCQFQKQKLGATHHRRRGRRVSAVHQRSVSTRHFALVNRHANCLRSEGLYLHTVGVTGSIPVAPAIHFWAAFCRYRPPDGTCVNAWLR
jgi:hypothetical protein